MSEMARGRDVMDLPDDHARVFEAVSRLETAGEPAYPQRVAEVAGCDLGRAKEVLSDLVNDYDLVTRVGEADTPDFGPRYVLQPED
ncbi:hypothetical protein [Bailinhaonella thermotolerans]|uniref:Uncharacterized protein n=1 Tax=Bailinhaonella thermotolerans TaxID=1070861 RepID=A0A3A4A130_9ACTN|nr:hypothetical protein [Bailinhaonella thermotolerans]RJL20670.1 hypothetical protein D5H75_39045 [Bailinhaonella thermotolerans]